MPKIPHIKKVASIALDSIDSVLNHWLPGGKKESCEYVVRNPTRADGKPGSFSINLRTGAWSDFATNDKGKDLVSLVAYLENEPQGKAAERLASFLGIEPEESNTPKRAGSDSKQSVNSKPSISQNESNSAKNPGGDDDAGNVLCRFPIMHLSHPQHTRGTANRQSVIRTMIRMAALIFIMTGTTSPRVRRNNFHR